MKTYGTSNAAVGTSAKISGTLTSIENVYLNKVFTATQVDASVVAGVTSIEIDNIAANDANASTLVKIGTGQSVKLSNVGAVAAGNGGNGGNGGNNTGSGAGAAAAAAAVGAAGAIGTLVGNVAGLVGTAGAAGAAGAANTKGQIGTAGAVGGAGVAASATIDATSSVTTLNLTVNAVTSAGAGRAGKAGLAGATSATIGVAGSAGGLGGAGGAAAVMTVDIAAANASTLALTATGANSSFTLTNTGGQLTKITVTGDKQLTVVEAMNAVRVIDASTSTGGAIFDVSGATQVVGFTFTGGAGNDKLTVAAGQLAVGTGLTSGAQIDFGAGSNTLVTKDAAPVYATINAMKNLQIVQFSINTAVVDMAQLTPSKVIIGGFAVATVSNIESTDTVTISGNVTTSATLGGAVGNSIGNITLGSATNNGMTIASLVTSGLTTVNLASTGTNWQPNVITAITNSDNTSFNITGSNDLTLSVTAAATVTGNKIDANAFTGNLTATGSDLADIIIGGSGNDRINAGLLGDTLSGGSGADTFVYTGTVDALFVNSLAAAAGIDRITDFTVGSDKISLTNAATTPTGVTITAVTVATAADLAAFFTAVGNLVAASTATALQVGLVTVGAGTLAGTYLLVNDTANAAAATDTLINITGVAGTVTAADFVFA